MPQPRAAQANRAQNLLDAADHLIEQGDYDGAVRKTSQAEEVYTAGFGKSDWRVHAAHRKGQQWQQFSKLTSANAKELSAAMDLVEQADELAKNKEYERAEALVQDADKSIVKITGEDSDARISCLRRQAMWREARGKKF